MKNILLVDDDEQLLIGMEDYFKELVDEFTVHTALNGKSAVEVLESALVDLVVTDLKMPEMDGIELLAHMNRMYPHTPAVVLSAYGSPEVRERLDRIGSFQFVPKPCVLDDLKQAVVDELKHISQKGHVKDISTGSFLQLIEMEEKTCFLEVMEKGGRTGNFFFNKGELLHASLGDIEGEKAALEMISWDKVQVFFRSLPRKAVKRNVYKGVMSLILESSRAREEEAKSAPPGEPEATEKTNGGESRESAAPEPDAEKTDELGDKLKTYGNFDGFLGIALFDALGSPVAMHAREDFDIMNVGVLIVELMLRSMNILKKAGSEEAHMIYMETENVHAFISMVDSGGNSEHPEEDETNHYIILIASAAARIGLVKKKFELAAGGLAEALNN